MCCYAGASAARGARMSTSFFYFFNVLAPPPPPPPPRRPRYLSRVLTGDPWGKEVAPVVLELRGQRMGLVRAFFIYIMP